MHLKHYAPCYHVVWNEKYKGYWIEASFWSADPLISFLFFDKGVCFDFCFLLFVFWRTIVLKDWNQSWRLIRSPCSWASEYLQKKKNVNSNLVWCFNMSEEIILESLKRDDMNQGYLTKSTSGIYGSRLS